MKLGRNYWRLWTASVTSNLGDGVGQIAYPWLASLITRSGFKLGLVVLVGRLPWLVFSLPAGVITDRFDRRKLLIAMDLFRSVLTIGVAVLVVANQGPLQQAEATILPNENLLLAVLCLATFLFGMAEVLRDNTAQTFMPALVDKAMLERANGRLWGAEMVMNSFVGPPLAGFLLAWALAVPFFLHSATFLASALLILLIVGDFRPQVHDVEKTAFGVQLREGFRWLWQHRLLRSLAVSLAILNGAGSMALATFVLFSQEVLGLDAVGFGVLMTAGAAGGVLGSLLASRLVDKVGKGTVLMSTFVVGGVTYAVMGLTSLAAVVWLAFVLASFVAVAWNVITVSLRQRIIPDRLLGRVNAVYRFFGLGMMSIGAVLGGAMVSLLEAPLGRVWALRLPFLIAGVVQLGALFYAGSRLSTARIGEAEEAAIG